MAAPDARFECGKEKRVLTSHWPGVHRVHIDTMLIWLNVSHGVNLARLLRFVLKLFLANTCLHAFKWVIQTSGQIVWFK